jgi:hypothetical protein
MLSHHASFDAGNPIFRCKNELVMVAVDLFGMIGSRDLASVGTRETRSGSRSYLYV